MQTLNIDDFASYRSQMMYYDDDVFVSGSIEGMPHQWNQPLRLNFFCIMTCIAGEMQVEVNSKNYNLSTGDSLIALPTMILGGAMVSPIHKVHVIGFSTRFLQRVMTQNENDAQVLQHFRNNPVRHKSDFGDLSIYRYYSELICTKVAEPASSPLRKEILDHLFSALLCEMLNDLTVHQTLTFAEQMEDEKGGKSQRGTEIFHRFIKEVSADNGMHRSLNYFAERLCYTPKYVSNTIKMVSGRTALDWINEITMEQIKYQLKHTSKSMKEIADEFNFPNQSFFGKYVKKHLGMPPARYRE